MLTHCMCHLPFFAMWMLKALPWPPLQVLQILKKVAKCSSKKSWNFLKPWPGCSWWSQSLSVTGRWSGLFLWDIFHANQWQRGLQHFLDCYPLEVLVCLGRQFFLFEVIAAFTEWMEMFGWKSYCSLPSGLVLLLRYRIWSFCQGLLVRLCQGRDL